MLTWQTRPRSTQRIARASRQPKSESNLHIPRDSINKRGLSNPAPVPPTRIVAAGKSKLRDDTRPSAGQEFPRRLLKVLARLTDADLQQHPTTALLAHSTRRLYERFRSHGHPPESACF